MQRTEEQEKMYQFFQKLWEGGIDEDTDKLGYSEQSSDFRMKACAAYIEERRVGAVFDIGCGTGKLLDHLQQCEVELTYYLGVDIMPRGEHVAQKLSRTGIPGAFLQTSYPSTAETILETLRMNTDGMTCFVGLGIVGYGDYGNAAELADFFYGEYSNYVRGFVTVPIKFDESKQNPNINYFDATDVELIAAEINGEVLKLFPHEYVIIW